MIPMLLWVLCLFMSAALAWRAVTQGGPWADWLWIAIGGLSLAILGGALWDAVPRLWAAIAAENIMDPKPLFRADVVVCALLVFLRPHRRKAREVAS